MGILSLFKTPKDDPLDMPETAFGELQEDKYKGELELVDRYQTFVGELLRLSLLGIAVFGYLYKITFENNANMEIAKYPAAAGVVMFGICALTALIFRYFATEGARFYIQALRYTPTNNAGRAQEERAEESINARHGKVVICRWSKASAAIALGLGGVSESAAFCLLLFAP